MPNYKQKLINPLQDQQFLKGMKEGRFANPVKHRGLIAFIHYTALRICEALRLERKDFRLTPNTLYVTVSFPVEKYKKVTHEDGTVERVPTGKIVYERLKHSKVTPPLPIDLDLPYVDCIVDSFKDLTSDKRVWPYCRKTGYNIVNRVFTYPHYHRLSRITQFFLDGFTIAEVRSWTGLTLNALNYYVGLVGIDKMGRSLMTKNKRG